MLVQGHPAVKSGAYTIDVASRPLGRNYGGKNGVAVSCPVCNRPGLKWKAGRKEGIYFVDYAHALSIDLNHKNEPVVTASQICRKPERDPSQKGSKAQK